jgi:2-keto-3-deoxy-L-rhamnonate aldolase RhmA
VTTPATDPYRLKSRIAAREPVYGLMAGDLAAPALIQLAAAAGLDFLVFDAEHSAFSDERLAGLLELCVLRGVAPLVRVQPDEALVQKAIHLGAAGVMLPGVRDAGTAAELIAAAYLPPAGHRGFSRHSAPSRLGGAPGQPRSHQVARQNSWVVVVLQIETAGLAGDLAAAASLPGADVLLLGATDLSVSLGLTDAPVTDPRITSALRFDGGPAKGAVINAAAPAEFWQQFGASFFLLGHDTDVFEQGLQSTLAQVPTLTAPATPV